MVREPIILKGHVMLILLPVDGSEASLDAVHFALKLQHEGLKASFVLANVQESTQFYEVVLAPDPELLHQASLEAGEHALRAAQALLTAAGADFEPYVGIGEPGHVLVDMAQLHGCDAVLMGSQGTGLLGGARLGSVCQWVLLHASVPVTIVRHADPDDQVDNDDE
jgi:nucleotide-binding universal stress UspA family protein